MGLSVAERLACLPGEERQQFLAEQTPEVLNEMLRGEWWYVGRPEQMPPDEGDWLVALALAGRGWGKSRASGEWLVKQVIKHPYDQSGAPTEWLLIAETLADARTICLEGPAGVLRILERREIAHRYKQSPRPMILFPDGQKIYAEGADDADVGRGYNAAGAVLDEVAKWVKPYESWWEGILPSLRADLFGDHPRAFVATTPKPIRILQEWVGSIDGSVHLMGGSTFDNASNLSSFVLASLERKYRGTAIGQQELYGKILELNAGGLFTRMDIVNHRVPSLPEDVTLVSTVVGMDPNLTGEDAQTGLVAAGRGSDGEIYILGDRTIQGSGRQAALAAWRAVAEFEADVLVYEENLGKRYLFEVLQDAYREYCELDLFPRHTSPPMKGVHAKHGKKTRAEPVAMRSEQGALHFVGEMPELEDQCVMYDPLAPGDSPDRMDAMVHAVIFLMAGEKKRMKIGKPGLWSPPNNFYDLDQFGPMPSYP
jgi:phage terminase large subunit-like protein